MNKYLIFGYDDYYPGGGMNDCLGIVQGVSEMLVLLNKNRPENIQICLMTDLRQQLNMRFDFDEYPIHSLDLLFRLKANDILNKD